MSFRAAWIVVAALFGALAWPAAARGACPQLELVAQPPAALPTSLSARFPSGVEVGFTVTLDADGRPGAVRDLSTDPNRSDDAASRSALRAILAAWARDVRFAPLPAACPQPRLYRFENVDFFPASSGVLGVPASVRGVDFGELRYTDGPGNCTTAAMHGGTASSPEGEYEASVENVFAGRVGATLAAVAVLRCEYNGHGYDEVAQVFAVENGRAQRIGVLGQGSMTGPDSIVPPWPGAWLHVAFRDGRLYADVWDPEHRCSARDWIVSTYTVEGSTLRRVARVAHHRADLQRACDG